MRKPSLFLILSATLSVAPIVPSLFAQSSGQTSAQLSVQPSAPSRVVFVLPSLEPDPTLNLPTTSQPIPPGGIALTSLESNAILNPAAMRPSPASRRHTPLQPDVPPELVACRKRYADAVYKIGLALWTAPPVQRTALERLLNASSAVQSVVIDPKTVAQDMALCSDATLSSLEATVVRLKAKGWVPLTPVEEHVARSNSIADELRRALDAIWR